jgi:hypothetical protein
VPELKELLHGRRIGRRLGFDNLGHGKRILPAYPSNANATPISVNRTA